METHLMSLDQDTGRQKFINYFTGNWVYVFMLLAIAVFSVTGKGFINLGNIQNIIHLSTILIILATAETFVIVTGGIDLSVGMMLGLASVTAAKIMQMMYAAQYSLPLLIGCAILVSLVLTLILGTVSGLLVAYYNLPPFIATLGMWGVANGLALKISDGYPISFLPPQLAVIGNSFFFYYRADKGLSFLVPPEGLSRQSADLVKLIPTSIVYVGVILAVTIYILNRTRFGRHVFAIGGNVEAAKRVGVNLKNRYIKIYALSGLLAGLAGVFDLFQVGVGNFTRFSAMYELFAIAGVIIGGASLMGGRGKIINSVAGVLLIGILESGLLASGVEPYFRFIAVGVLMLVAVIMDNVFPDRN